MTILPRLSIISMGGTIAMTKAPHSGGVEPTLTADSLVATVPTLSTLAHVHVRSFRALPGASIGFSDILNLAGIIDEEQSAGSAGIVITQGTDTIEETAFALDLILGLNREVAVSLTGAMRNPSLPGAEGPANLDAAARFVLSDGAADAGVVVVMNDEVHEARFVHKVHTSFLPAFESRIRGPIGWLTEGRVRLLPPSSRYASLRPHLPVPAVALVATALGDDGRILDKLPALGFAGAVIEGLGGGHVPGAWVDKLDALTKLIPVVLTSRVPNGEVLSSTYDFQGSEMDLNRRGILSGGFLDGPKARILLSMLLATGLEVNDLRAAFELRATTIR